MNTKQRDVVFQRWCGEIGREARNLPSLEQTSRRAMGDSDVREDPTLQSMIRAEVQKRRAELEQRPKVGREPPAARKSEPDGGSPSPELIPEAPPEQIREEFNRLAQTLSELLERRAESETIAVVGRMKALHKQSPGVIPAAVMENYEQRVKELRIHIKQLNDEIALRTEQALSATGDGNEQDLARSMRRLTAIHAAHPRLLDESGLEDIRCGVARAADERCQHQLTTKTLLERERAITAEIKAMPASFATFIKWHAWRRTQARNFAMRRRHTFGRSRRFPHTTPSGLRGSFSSWPTCWPNGRYHPSGRKARSNASWTV